MKRLPYTRILGISCLLLLLFFSCNNADNAHTDNDFSETLDSLISLSKNAVNKPTDTFVYYIQMASALSRKEGSAYQKAEVAFGRASYFFNASQFDAAWMLCDTIDAYLVHVEKDTTFLQNKIDVFRSAILLRQGKFRESLDWAFKVYPKVEQSNDQASLFRLMNNIGTCNLEMLRYEEAIRWYKKMLETENADMQAFQAIASQNLGDCYANMNQLDSAKKYCEIAIDISGKINYTLIQANALNTLGKIYGKQGNYQEAEKAILKSSDIRKKIGDPFYIVADLIQLANLYTNMGRFEQAVETAEKALKLVETHDLQAQYYYVASALYKSYYARKDYKKAAEFARQMTQVLLDNDSTASAKAIAEMEVKYETSKKEQQIQEQQYQLERKNVIIIGSIILLVFLVLIAYIFFRNIQHKQNRKLQEVIIKEQDEAAKAVIQAEEQERSRMSQTLHDGVGQLLSGLKMNLEALEDRVDMKEGVKIYHNSLSLLEETIHEIRNVSHQILPNNILRLGLTNALRSLIEKIDQRKLQIKLNIEGMMQHVDPNIQLMVYRILQESINNVLKHSRAQVLYVDLKVTEETLSAVILDDGVGFDTESVSARSGIGLNNIFTRIRFLKGNYNIESIIGKGTKLSFEIPLS